jgi:hypothetical protein
MRDAVKGREPLKAPDVFAGECGETRDDVIFVITSGFGDDRATKRRRLRDAAAQRRAVRDRDIGASEADGRRDCQEGGELSWLDGQDECSVGKSELAAAAAEVPGDKEESPIGGEARVVEVQHRGASRLRLSHVFQMSLSKIENFRSFPETIQKVGGLTRQCLIVESVRRELPTKASKSSTAGRLPMSALAATRAPRGAAIVQVQLTGRRAQY